MSALGPILEKRGGQKLKEKAADSKEVLKGKNWTANRNSLKKQLIELPKSEVIDPSWMLMTIIDTMPEDTIFVDEGIISTRSLPALLPYRDETSLFGMASGGIGWGVPAACGIQAAFPDRQVIAVIGDGSSMYSIQALWTAANQKLPINYIICDNGGYRIIKERLYAFHGNENFIGMDFKEPAVDFVGLAKSLGLPSTRVSAHDELVPALQEALSNRAGPNLISVSVDKGKF